MWQWRLTVNSLFMWFYSLFFYILFRSNFSCFELQISLYRDQSTKTQYNWTIFGATEWPVFHATPLEGDKLQITSSSAQASFASRPVKYGTAPLIRRCCCFSSQTPNSGPVTRTLTLNKTIMDRNTTQGNAVLAQGSRKPGFFGGAGNRMWGANAWLWRWRLVARSKFGKRN